MKLPSVVCILIPLTMISACLGEANESPVPTYFGNDPNAAFSDRLLPNELRFDRVMKGQKIGPHSLIVMPPSGEKALLTVEFKRSDLQESFIREFFFGDDANVARIHPFAREGIEPVLTDQRFILNIHSGVLLHLRNDMGLFPNYSTFASDNVMGEVMFAEGNIFYSSDPKIESKLGDFFAAYRGGNLLDISETEIERLSDGSYRVTTPLNTIPSPKRYPPKVIEGP